MHLRGLPAFFALFDPSPERIVQKLCHILILVLTVGIVHILPALRIVTLLLLLRQSPLPVGGRVVIRKALQSEEEFLIVDGEIGIPRIYGKLCQIVYTLIVRVIQKEFGLLSFLAGQTIESFRLLTRLLDRSLDLTRPLFDGIDL